MAKPDRARRHALAVNDDALAARGNHALDIAVETAATVERNDDFSMSRDRDSRDSGGENEASHS